MCCTVGPTISVPFPFRVAHAPNKRDSKVFVVDHAGVGSSSDKGSEQRSNETTRDMLFVLFPGAGGTNGRRLFFVFSVLSLFLSLSQQQSLISRSFLASIFICRKTGLVRTYFVVNK